MKLLDFSRAQHGVLGGSGPNCLSQLLMCSFGLIQHLSHDRPHVMLGMELQTDGDLWSLYVVNLLRSKLFHAMHF